MKIKTVITKQSRYKQPFIFNNDTKALILSALAIFMGFITSIIPVISDLTIINSELDNRFINYLNAFSEDNLINIFIGIFVPLFMYLVLCCVFGTCALGCFPALITTYIKSLGMALSVFYVIYNFKLKGLEYILITQLPGKIIMIFCMLMLTKFAVKSSVSIKQSLLKKDSTDFEKQTYIKQNTLMLLFVFLSALTDSVMIKAFSSLFSFKVS